MYLVTGATGNVGGSLARQLHEHGHGAAGTFRGWCERNAGTFR